MIKSLAILIYIFDHRTKGWSLALHFFSISSMKVFPCTSVENQHHPSPSDHQTKTDCSCFICICKASLYACLVVIFGTWLVMSPSTPQSHVASLSRSGHTPVYLSPQPLKTWQPTGKPDSESVTLASRINKFTWKRVFLSISYKYDMLTWILTQPYQQDPKNVACVDLDFSLVDSSVNSQVIDGTRKHKVNGILNIDRCCFDGGCWDSTWWWWDWSCPVVEYN